MADRPFWLRPTRALRACAWILAIALTSTAISVSPTLATSPQPPAPSTTNRLADSTSPYLLLHADNPVDWYPWGPEAFERARAEDKPIFLSVGYSTCYWCHVAERTLYSDPAIARLMNQWFVNVKVDREQRPDVDRVYLLATEVMTGAAGWPNNLFLTPDLKPFFAGSYYPPADDELGRPGFPTVLSTIHDQWVNRREKVLTIADNAYVALAQAQQAGASAAAVALEPSAWLERAARNLSGRFDERNGGFGAPVGPRFPQAPALRLLLAHHRATGNQRSLDMLRRTLDAMASGGIRDHVGGGFHRYTVEPTWSIPHFEKMLYDNAQLLALYADAYAQLGDPLYADVARETADYLVSDLMAPEGGFYTAWDAAIGEHEGASYLWSEAQIRDTIGAEATARLLALYELRPMLEQGEAALLDGQPLGVLRVRAAQPGVAAAVAVRTLAPLRAALLAARDARPQPARDEKMVVALNGLAIEALVRASALLNEPRYLDAARASAQHIWEATWEPRTRTLWHQTFRGRADTAGFLDDYALLGRAYLALSAATGDTVWRDRAVEITDALLERFARGGELATTASSDGLPLLGQDTGDEVLPSGTSAAIDLLLRLAAATGEERYALRAVAYARGMSGRLAAHPHEWAAALEALTGPAAAAPAVVAALSAEPDVSPALPESADHVRATGTLHAAGSRAELVVELDIAPGWHVNANPASLDYLIPTEVRLDGIAAASARYPAGRPLRTGFASETLSLYEGLVRIAVPLAVSAAAPSVSVRLQACSAEVCLPPSTIPVPVTIDR